MDEMREEYDFSQGTRGAVLHHDGETCITLYVNFQSTFYVVKVATT